MINVTTTTTSVVSVGRIHFVEEPAWYAASAAPMNTAAESRTNTPTWTNHSGPSSGERLPYAMAARTTVSTIPKIATPYAPWGKRWPFRGTAGGVTDTGEVWDSARATAPVSVEAGLPRSECASTPRTKPDSSGHATATGIVATSGGRRFGRGAKVMRVSDAIHD